MVNLGHTPVKKNLEENLANLKFGSGQSTAASAESAGAGGPAKMADIDEKTMPMEAAKVEKIGKFFNICEDAAVNKFRIVCKNGFNKLVMEGTEKYYVLPESIYQDAEKLEADFEAHPKDNKLQMQKKISSFYTGAMEDMSQQTLGVLVPGQVEVISRLHEVEEKMEANMTKIGTSLEDILVKFTFYAKENASLNTKLQVSTKAINDLRGEVRTYRDENEKMRQEMGLNHFDQQNYESQQAPYVGIQNPVYAHNFETGFQFDRDHPGAAELKNQLNRQKRETKKGPPGTNIDWQSSSNAGVIKGNGSGANLRAGVGPGGDQDRNGMGQGQGSSQSDRSRSQPREQPQNKGKDGFELPRGRRHKARNNTNPETEAGRKSFKDRMMAREFIIHGVESQNPETFSNKTEAELVQNFFTEIGVTHLEHFGVDIDIRNDVTSQIRLKNHWEANPDNKPGEGGWGCAPIKVKMVSDKVCNKVLRAAEKGGCLSVRRPVFIGKYKEQRKFDRAGLAMENDETVAAMAATRPKYFIRPSIPKEKRDKLKIAREKRDNDNDQSEQTEQSAQNAQNAQKWKKRKEEIKSDTIYYGEIRNFPNGSVDVNNEIMLEGKKRRKEAAEVVRLKKEDEKAERAAQRNSTEAGKKEPGSEGALGNNS